MNVINRLTMGSLLINKRRTLITIIGVLLSTALICGVISLSASFQQLFVRQAVNSSGNWHGMFLDVSYQNSKYITANAFTKEAMFVRDVGVAWVDISADKPYLFVQEYDEYAFENLPITLLEGRLPENSSEIVISEWMLGEKVESFQVGNTITVPVGIRIDQGEIINCKHFLSESEEFSALTTKNYKITGVIARPIFEFVNSPGYLVVSYLDKTKLSAEDRVDIAFLAVNPHQVYSRAPDLLASAQANFVRYNEDLLKWLGVTLNDRTTAMFYSLIAIILLVVLVGSVTVIYNAFFISVSERKREFGMLASVGATTAQIRKTVFLEAITLGLIGIPLGVLSGLTGVWVTLMAVNRLMPDLTNANEFAIRLVVSPFTLIATILLVGLIVLISAYIPAKLAAKASPLEAIRLNKDIHSISKELKLSPIIKRLFGIEGALAMKNLKRNGKKYQTTIFSLFISIILFISFTSFLTYGFQVSSMYYGDIHYDIAVNYFDASPQKQDELYQRIATFNGVERYSIVRVLSGFFVNIKQSQLNDEIKEFLLTPKDEKYLVGFRIVSVSDGEFKRYLNSLGLDQKDYFDPHNLRGILVNKNLDRDDRIVKHSPLNIAVGTKFSMINLSEPEIPNIPIEIAAIVDELPLGVNYASSGNVNIIVSATVYREIRSSEAFDRGQIFIQSSNSSLLAQEITSATDANQQGSGISIVDMSSIRAETETTKTMMSIFLYGFLALITLIGITNVFNTVSTNVALRRREFAMLRSVGLTPQGFKRMIRYESLFYGLKSLMYGLPVGIIISVLLYNSFANMFRFKLVLPWNAIFYCIIGVFSIVALTMRYSVRKFKSENIIDAIRDIGV